MANIKICFATRHPEVENHIGEFKEVRVEKNMKQITFNYIFGIPFAGATTENIINIICYFILYNRVKISPN